MDHNRLQLHLHKYRTAGRSQFNIDKLSDDEDEFDQSSISDMSSDSDLEDLESESFPDTESTGPSEATTDELNWGRIRAPMLGISAHARRLSLDLKPKNHIPMGGYKTKSSECQSQNDLSQVGSEQSSSSVLYSRIDRGDRNANKMERSQFAQPRLPRTCLMPRKPIPRTSTANPNSKDLSIIDELSPIRSAAEVEMMPPPPLPLRNSSEWNQKLTATSTPYQLQLPAMPKTNPHFSNKFAARSKDDEMSSATASSPYTPYQRRYQRNSKFRRPAETVESLTGESDIDFESPVPWTKPPMPKINPHSLYVRPEQCGLPSALAKNLGINGIIYLAMSLCGRRLTLNVQRGIYFREPSQSQVCSYLRAELRHRGRSHHRDSKRHRTSSSQSSHRRTEETYRTRLLPTTNKPMFHETFNFTLPAHCERDYLVLTVYAMESDETQRKKVLGCMAFPISRILKKARAFNNFDYSYCSSDTENLEDVEINNEGYFLLDPKHGEKRNLPQSKVKRQTFYNDAELSGTTSRSSTISHEKMTAGSSRLSIPNELNGGDYYCSTSDLRDTPIHNLDYTSASSSTNGSSTAEMKHKFHRATLPSITTTTSENTSDDTPSPERNHFDNHYLFPDDGGVYGAGPVVPIDDKSKKKSSGGLVRRAASFTFSPKATNVKSNQRFGGGAHFGQDEKERKGLFGPISKTLTFLRNKMDTALSTSTLYPTRDDVRQWENCFESLLQNKFGCALFRQFLKKEFSDENVDFWLECEEFKKMKDGKKSTTQKAYEIYKEFVAEHAPKEVNLDSDTRAATKAALENGCKTDTFSLAQNRVEQLMSKDSYRRFLRDRLFLDLVESFDHEKDKETKETTPKEK